VSRLARLYDRVYASLCGTHPNVMPWHFQWLPVKDLYADIRRLGPRLAGRVLDVGCGDKPYTLWLTSATSHVGIDVAPGPWVDAVIRPEVPWPYPDASFDSVLCTQVLEHATDLTHVLSEVHRVLKPGGLVIVSVPFAYNEHGVPDDYRRLSAWGLRRLFEDDYEILELVREGAIGSTIGTLWLNWIESATARHRALHAIKALLLPVWLLGCALTNALGAGLDALDRTQAYYGNVMMLAMKRGGAAGRS
jgi:SAM-dependent methyltransferase